MLSLSVDPIIFSKMPIKRTDSLVKHGNDKKKGIHSTAVPECDVFCLE